MKQRIAVIDYNAGNVQSVLFALKKYEVEAVLTSDHEQIKNADKVLFPGVGEASTTMQFLKNKGLDTLLPALQQPLLGICLGLQLMCSHSEENDTACLGILPVQVKKFDTTVSGKVPHMGWNQLLLTPDSWLPNSLNHQYVYFVHSFYAELNAYTEGMTPYGINFSSVIRKDNFFATQFHVEKSGPVGLKILETFLNLKSK